MSAKELMITPNNLSTILLHEKPHVGQAILVTGAVPADTNPLLHNFFRAVVSTQPNEEEEEQIGVLYLTRSRQTQGELKHFADNQRSRVGLEYYVRTYSRFDADEILEVMADLEDDLELRYVIIEDIDLWPRDEVRQAARKLRDATQHGFLLVASSAFDRKAHEIRSIEQDSSTFLELMRDGHYDKTKCLPLEFDVQILIDADEVQEHEGLTQTNVLIAKHRGHNPAPRNFFRVCHKLGVYQ